MMIADHIPARIEDANRTLREVARKSKNGVASKIPKSAVSEIVNSSENNAIESLTEQKRSTSGNSPQKENRADLLNVVTFQKGNFVRSWHPPANTCYHAILW